MIACSFSCLAHPKFIFSMYHKEAKSQMEATMQPDLTEKILELIRRTSSSLPADVEEAPEGVHREGGTRLGGARRARNHHEEHRALAPEFHAHLPGHRHTHLLRVLPGGLEHAQAARADPQPRWRRRPNAPTCVPTPWTPSTTRTAATTWAATTSPTSISKKWKATTLTIELMLKGGGCENVGAQYSLPNNELGAGRDLAGVRKVVLDAVQKAQGQGCAPGILGVAIGGDRGSVVCQIQGSPVRPVGRTQRGPGTGLARGTPDPGSEHNGHRPDGLWRQDDGHRYQDHRAAPPAGQRISSRCRTCAGLTAAAR